MNPTKAQSIAKLAQWCEHNAVIQQKITAQLDKIDKLKKLILQSRREVVRLQGELNGETK